MGIGSSRHRAAPDAELPLRESEPLPDALLRFAEIERKRYAIAVHGGIGVLVATRPQQTHAHYRLDDPDATGRFLRALIEEVAP